MNEDIIILDDFLPIYIQDELEKICRKIPWVLDDFSLGKGYPTSPQYKDHSQFVHIFWHKQEINEHMPHYMDLSHYFNLPLQIAGLKLGLKFKINDNLFRAKLNLTHNNTPIPLPAPPHRDIVGLDISELKKTWSIIYYMSESDGDTIIYNETEEYKDLSKYTIKKRISPKKGRIIFMRGDLFHSSSPPSSKYSKRIVINYNLIF